MSVRARAALLALLVVLAGCASLPSGSPSGGPATVSGGTGPASGGPSRADGTTSTAGTTGTATPTPVPASRPQTTATITRVVDGDTMHVRFPDGSTDTIRLLGVDTPETYGESDPAEFEGVPDTPAGRECLSTWGERATAYATDRLDGETVELGFDPQEGRRGYYGRLLAYVWIDGRQFNYDLIREGYARMYDSNFVERPRYAPAEERARAARRGLWTCVSPADGGASTTATDGGATASPTADGSGSPVGVAVHADAPGNDNENLNGEYVTLTNRGDAALDLSGWTVADEADHTYAFVDGTSLAPGESITLYTGSGTDTATERYWGESRAVWNNDGDTVYVRDADGDLVTTHQYSG
ncbi:MAG: lamin tail domain-containing protein [Haloferacaceae archaeon]